MALMGQTPVLLLLLLPLVSCKNRYKLPRGMDPMPDEKGPAQDEWKEKFESIISDCRRFCPGKFCDMDTCDDITENFGGITNGLANAGAHRDQLTIVAKTATQTAKGLEMLNDGIMLGDSLWESMATDAMPGKDLLPWWPYGKKHQRVGPCEGANWYRQGFETNCTEEVPAETASHQWAEIYAAEQAEPDTLDDSSDREGAIFAVSMRAARLSTDEGLRGALQGNGKGGTEGQRFTRALMRKQFKDPVELHRERAEAEEREARQERARSAGMTSGLFISLGMVALLSFCGMACTPCQPGSRGKYTKLPSSEL